jgi:hypothetical protein
MVLDVLLGSGFNDAMVLLAVWRAEHENEGTWISLWRILFWVDAMDHAILNPSEIEHAVRRLAPAGLVAVSLDGGFAMTPKGRELVASSVSAGRTAHQVIEELAGKLPDPQTSSTWSLAEDTYARAVEEYETWFRATMKELDEKEHWSGDPPTSSTS